ncbi:MAG TPA: VOC family protein [Alphaproteobacteria bacterium]|nr:VOC family protein [Alphaproteobacteria bacterium]
MLVSRKIVPCLWFDSEAEEAAKFYVSLFPTSKIVDLVRYTKEGVEIHRRPEGSVMVVMFRIEGQEFVALNGGPLFKFNEAISFQVQCETQDEVDHYWEGMGKGGDPAAQQCGWLKDRFGVSWQIVPKILLEMLRDPDRRAVERVTKAFLQMKKFDIATLERAYAGERR